MPRLHLMSHEVCPYVQRAAILLLEKNIPFEKTYIDLKNKPDWFLKISPLGKVPVLKVDEEVLFESAAICEFLDESYAQTLHPSQPLLKAKHRAWMEFSSNMLTTIWNFTTAQTESDLETRRTELDKQFATLETVTQAGPYFAGKNFSMVDAFFAPVFRYFEVFEQTRDLKLFSGRPKVETWRQALRMRDSVQKCVPSDYAQKLIQSLKARNSLIAKEFPA